MKVKRRVKQTKFYVKGLKGLLTLHDSGTIAVSVEHKQLFLGMEYNVKRSYYCIEKPTTGIRTVIMDRLFELDKEKE